MVKKIGKSKKHMLTMSEDKEFPRMESHEWYKGEFVETEFGEGQYGPYVTLKFKLLNGETEDGESAKGLVLSSMCNADLSPSSPLYAFVQVFEGDREIEMEEEIDLEAYIGWKGKVFVQDRENKKAKKNDKVYQNIKKIRNLDSKKKKGKKKKGKK